MNYLTDLSDTLEDLVYVGTKKSMYVTRPDV